MPARRTPLRLATLLLSAVALLAARPHVGAAQREGGLNFTGALSINLPTGSLTSDVGSGIGIMIRNASRRSGDWGLRTGLSFDRFSGKGRIDNLQFFTFFGGELVRYVGDHAYLFAGVGAYNTRVAEKTTAVSGTDTTSRKSSGFDFGFQGGVGANFSIMGLGMFVESGIIHVITVGPSTSWVPVRIGLRL